MQIFDAAQAAIPSLDEKIAAGEFGPLREWLRTHIHSQGSLHPSLDALLVAATGKPLTPSIYVASLRKKYTELYQL